MKSRSPTRLTDLSRPGGPGAGAFVLGVWAGLFAAALGFVLCYGPAFPRWDDFAMVPVLTGARRVSVEWLWSQHNEHRVPLPRLALLSLLRLSAGDFRAGMIFNVVALGCLALGMVLVARKVSGTWRETDAFFPLILLHLGHHANLLWAWQVQFVLSTVLAGGFLLVIVSGSSWPGPRKVVLAGGMLALLPLCGANGVALAPALSLWLLTSAAAHLIEGGPSGRRAGLLTLAVTSLSLVPAALYFRDYRAAAHHTIEGGISASLATAVQFLSLTLGPSAARLGPYAGLLVAVLLVASVGLLIGVVIRLPGERPRALGLLASLGGLVSLAVGLGWGRAGSSGLGGFEPRYVTLTSPLGCTFYFVWDLYGGTPALRRLITLGLLATMLVVLWPNSQAGLEAGTGLAEAAVRFEREVHSGTPMYLVIKHATPFLHPSEDELTSLLPTLRDSGVGVFRHLRPNPDFREVALPVAPSEVQLARWESGTAHITGVDPQLTYILLEGLHVAGVRLRYAHANSEGTPARFQMRWRGLDQPPGSPDRISSNWNLPTGRDRTTTVWVGDIIREFRVQPDNRPCEFRIESITLLIPPG